MTKRVAFVHNKATSPKERVVKVIVDKTKHPNNQPKKRVVTRMDPETLVNTRTTYNPVHKNSGQVGVSNKNKIPGESFVVKSAKDGVIIRGTSLICELSANQAIVGATNGSVALQIPLHPALMNSWQLQRMAENYQKYIFKRVKVHLVSQLPTATAGLIMGAIYPSNETIPNLYGIGLKKFLQSNPSFREVSAWEKLSLTMPNSKFLPAYNMVLDDDPTTSLQGSIVLGTTNILANTYVGDVLVEYELSLFNMTAPIVNDTSGTPLVLAQNLTPVTTATGAYVSYSSTFDADPYNYWSKYPGIWQITTRNSLPARTGNMTQGTTLFLAVVRSSATQVFLYLCNVYSQALSLRYIEFGGTTTWPPVGGFSFYGFYLTSLGQNVPTYAYAQPSGFIAEDVTETHTDEWTKVEDTSLPWTNMTPEEIEEEQHQPPPVESKAYMITREPPVHLQELKDIWHAHRAQIRGINQQQHIQQTQNNPTSLNKTPGTSPGNYLHH